MQHRTKWKEVKKGVIFWRNCVAESVRDNIRQRKWRRANAWNVSHRYSERWPNYSINSVDKTKLSCNPEKKATWLFFFSLRCYLVDNLANLVTDPDFLLASTTDAREYERVSLGRKEGDVMKLLVTKHKFFVPNQRVDFQGICSVSPYAPKVCPY